MANKICAIYFTYYKMVLFVVTAFLLEIYRMNFKWLKSTLIFFLMASLQHDVLAENTPLPGEPTDEFGEPKSMDRSVEQALRALQDIRREVAVFEKFSTEVKEEHEDFLPSEFMNSLEEKLRNALEQAQRLSSQVENSDTPNADPQVNAALAQLGVLKQQVLGINLTQLQQASTYWTRMDAVVKGLQQRIEGARAEDDTILVSCLQAILTEIQSKIIEAKTYRGQFRDAVLSDDIGSRTAPYLQLTILYQEVITLGMEADSCVGQKPVQLDQGKTDTKEPDNSPTITDPTSPTTKVINVEPAYRPPVASPYMNSHT